jgi:cation-transporting ATPase E
MSSIPQGLSQAEVQARISAGQTNRQQNQSSRSVLSILRANVLTLFNTIVGGAFLVLLLLGQWKDALFGFAVISNVLIGVIQEFKSKQTLDRLAILNQPFARVRRDGEIVQLHIDDVVLDDLLELRAGDQIATDAALVEAENLEIDESLLTGEAEPVAKNVGDSLLSGSVVIAGRALAVATSVGADTYSSRLTLEARRFSLVKSELRNALNKVIKWISWALVPIMAITLNGQLQSVGGWDAAIASGQWLEATVRATASIISMIPQGLVLITSISFMVSALRLSKQNVLLQELPAVEGLARVDVVCFDKTGTLTEGEIVFDQAKALDSSNSEVWQSALAFFGAHPDANSTSRALADHFVADQSLHEVASVPFSSERKWSSFTFAENKSWILGAPEFVLDANDPSHATALKFATAEAEAGKRTLLLISSSEIPTEEAIPAHRTPAAIVTFKEKIRSDAHETLAYFAAQQVGVRVISGDNPKTVAAVAREAGLVFEGDGFDARDLPTNQTELAVILDSHLVFGRVTPDQKREMVHALQIAGHSVAMMGDGVNDALALKDADLGIAMGTGSAATKAVSNLILLDSKFASIPGLVSEGRKVIANVERVSRLFLTKTVWAMALAIAVGIMLSPFPFLPRQLSAVDGFTIGLPSFALALLSTNQRYTPGFLRRSLWFCIPSGIIVALAVIGLDVYSRTATAWNQPQSQTSTALLLSITGLAVLAALARPMRGWRALIFIGALLVFVAVFTIPFVMDFFGFAPLNLDQLLPTAIVGSVATILIEIVHRKTQK